MRVSVLIPHWKTGKLTAFTIAQLLKYKGEHDLKIIVGDNNSGDGSIEYLKPFENDITVVDYPKGKLQSHAIIIDYILELGLVETDYFITVESDCFPTKPGYLDYYENLIKADIDCAFSPLKLSGGIYGHPCGGLYRKSLWQEAHEYAKSVPYTYFPNASMKDTFASHLMVKNSFLETFLDSPESFIVVSDGYKNYTKEQWMASAEHYSPTVGAFHNGMGMTDESLYTYGQRHFDGEVPSIILDNKKALINRVGYEPGQWLSYYSIAKQKKVFAIPIEIKWMNGLGGQQQEYTLMENGLKHLWGSSAYFDYTPENGKEVALYKQSVPELLYESLPEHQKIKI